MNNREIRDLTISWLTISAAFAWIHVNFFSPGGAADFAAVLIIMLVAVGGGFILHELAHKYVAIYYGAHAEFVMWTNGLILAVALALTLGIVFAAPGAVYIYGRNITARQNGIISLAGPLTNLAIVLLAGLFYLAIRPGGFIETTLAYTMKINFFLAAFNMLPVFPLDGSKVFAWNKAAWLVTIAAAAFGVLFFPYVAAAFGML